MIKSRRSTPPEGNAKELVISHNQAAILLDLLGTRLHSGSMWTTRAERWHLNGIRGLVRRRMVQQEPLDVRGDPFSAYSLTRLGLAALRHFLDDQGLLIELRASLPDGDGVYQPPVGRGDPEGGLAPEADTDDPSPATLDTPEPEEPGDWMP